MSPRSIVASGVASVIVAGLFVGVLGTLLPACGGTTANDEEQTAADDSSPRHFGPPQLYHFQLEGPVAHLPFNHKLFFRVTTRDVWGEWEGGAIGEDGRFVIRGGGNERYHVRSEYQPTEAEAALFWMIDTRGRFPEEDTSLSVPLPPRTTVRVPVPEVQSSYTEMSFVREHEGLVGTVLNDPRTGLFEALWTHGDEGTSYKRTAHPAPFGFRGYAPGEYALAVRTHDRQWWTGRVTLEPGGVLEVPASEQPEGGGRVVVEDAEALLYLDGEFPVAAPRRRSDLRYRDVWEGVPPGRHELRWADGRRAPVQVEGGGEVLVQPPEPPRGED